MNLLPAFLIIATHIIGLTVAEPTVTLDNGTFTGTSSGNVSQFLGIPYAQPPVGNLRYRLPQGLSQYTGNNQATQYGSSCPQLSLNVTTIAPITALFLLGALMGPIGNSSEDCLTLNVIAPSSVTPNSKFPVVVWIYGGGFEFGSTSQYNGAVIVERSIALKEPVIYVSMNYRLSGFGFLASKEVKAAGVGNLGLQDQRFALKWIQKYISAFGGDPSKVTIWGESAGGISVSLQMLHNGGNTEGLFRGAFMESGFPYPIGPIEQGQPIYDSVVQRVGCSSANDTLDCLRTVPYEELVASFNTFPSIFSYQSIALLFGPRTDGVFLVDSPQQLVLKQQAAQIPFVTGDCDDEGTVFVTSILNVTTDSQFESYVRTIIFPNITDAEYETIAEAYPSDPTQGSPFDTGIMNVLTPEFKRLAAFDGDVTFHAPRRLFLNSLSGRQNAWSFLSKRQKSVPVFGAFHSSDLLNIYFGGDLADYLIHFINNLDPNGRGAHSWPQYRTSTRSLLTLWDGLIPVTITKDTFRQDAMNVLINISLTNPFV